ncbi:hypothetical protein L6452_13964 [Arctium lappa]|uniref:Uncharacterized protein n=1 Tax=Arctium lappa TaxID=4217 RepID=A0ACB9CJR7_ARCLA|nr:hypothetical protein L6452_13964 [Arctium lappa]
MHFYLSNIVKHKKDLFCLSCFPLPFYFLGYCILDPMGLLEWWTSYISAPGATETGHIIFRHFERPDLE